MPAISVSREDPLPGLQMAAFSYVLTLMAKRERAGISFSYQGTSHTGLEPHLYDLTYLYHLKALSPNTVTMNCGGTQLFCT